MESRRKRRSSQLLKWGCYALLLLLCTVLQTTPGLLRLGAAGPLFVLPLCIAVAVLEDEFASALFGVVGGLMWDYTAGRTAGMLALALLILCFLISVAVQLYLKSTPANVVLLCAGAAWLVLSGDFLFFYYMPGYAGAAQRYLTFVLPCVALTALVAWPLFWAARRIHTEFHIDTGVA